MSHLNRWSLLAGALAAALLAGCSSMMSAKSGMGFLRHQRQPRSGR